MKIKIIGSLLFVLFIVFVYIYPLLQAILLFLLIYLFPSIIAIKANHKQKKPIILTNILLGWSLLGWAVALIWCFLKPIDVSSNEIADEIEKLNQLKANGVLTEEEFQKQKRSLLAD